jgi:hypothetical protein
VGNHLVYNRIQVMHIALENGNKVLGKENEQQQSFKMEILRTKEQWLLY